ncbi:DNA replication complex GINS protein PSF2 [Sodiomyces alkalinus F11]|uniref:DNA replication complex GINS protein PSF2 n=1 Tax=Sodiomyces alkalinus (strain CBS 110278 / VKM F-3762 / F11) TaxID=1314773 RepID=A0A3N2Q6F9_SODAK|nr:DNA replication complex GINS protein PSF2 [Sodiomyces alkalinus F11]ROT42205.1 DNA replication complex GINS protein PSF2 [Sodiomyces alkalinus F11]
MALPLPSGLVPNEVGFLCEMESVTVVPRQRLDTIDLLSGQTPTLRPPYRANLPLWLALLLKKQRRANIVPPPWLHPDSLRGVIHHEVKVDPLAFSPPPPPPARADARGNAHHPTRPSAYDDVALSPPFLSSCTSDAPAGALPYHWFEVAEILLAHAADDIPSASEVRSLLRDLHEIRAAKMRKSTADLEQGVGGVLHLRGVGAMELAESRAFILGVVEGVRRLGASAEATRREEEEEGRARDEDEDDEDDDMFG